VSLSAEVRVSEEEQNETPRSDAGVDASNLLLIVVGAPWLEKFGPGINVGVVPIVCSDVWYMNQEVLHSRPTISLGGPGVNALSAYYFDKLNTAVTRENQIFIQLDSEFIDLRVCIWGMDHDLTVDALELFTRQHLDGYLRAVATQVEPQDE
jgi:hypothetical protein